MSAATDAFFGELRRYLRCAVCQRRVDSVERVFNLVSCTGTAVVRCHGAVEVVSVDSAVVENLLGSGRMSLGLAFDTRAIAPTDEHAAKKEIGRR